MNQPPTSVAAVVADLVAEMEKAVPTHLLPHIAKPEQVARVVQTTVDALAQDRYRRRGIPYVKYSGRVRYLRADVLKFMADNRIGRRRLMTTTNSKTAPARPGVGAPDGGRLNPFI